MFVIGTAGHVDHGKSLLVEALTGIDPDRLREEKARGMTIDLGFAWLTLPSGRSVSIVDVPGHERFIKNMLAGAGGIDLALLVVAADDGVMPQTREHLAILDLLGVSRGVVAITKRDLADDDWLALVAADITSTLRGTTLEGSPVVACSSRTREGLDDLLRALDAAVGELAPKRNVGRARLPIDRVFTIDGFGTVVTGTLIDGDLSLGDELEATPGGLRGRVRGLQNHKDKVERAYPGTRTAVNVAGIERAALRRGMVLAPPGALRPTCVLDARVRAIAPMRHNMHLTLHTGADEANAQLRLLDRDDLCTGEEAWAQVKLESAVAVEKRDRFVLRTSNDTVGGGIIVDIAPKRHRRKHLPTLDRLAAMLSEAPTDLMLDAVARSPLVERVVCVASASIDRETADAAIDALLASGAVRVFGDEPGALLATATYVDEAHDRAVDALAAYHAAHPLRAGIPVEDLRSRLRVDARQLAALIDGWPEAQSTTTTVSLASFRPAPSTEQRAAADAYLAALQASPERPPTLSIEPEVLTHLVQTGAVIDTGGGIVFDAQTFASMRQRVRSHIEQHGAITLAEARDLLGTSRRYVQSLLEHLDRERVTRRIGEARVLR